MSRTVNGRLAGRVALISGTARGMGRAAALRFAAEGATVAGGDLLEDEARETLSLIEDSGAVGSTTHLDVTDPRSVQAWVQAAAARFHRIDILYANAGAVRFGPIDEQPLADWRLTLTAELDSVFLTAQAAWPYLKVNGGVIITVGSTAGILGSTTNQRAAHTASKGGVIALTRQLAAEGAPHGIRAVCISPGMISTEGSRDNLLAADHPTQDRRCDPAAAAGHPGGRRRGRSVPGQRRRRLHHRDQPRHRRRLVRGAARILIAAVYLLNTPEATPGGTTVSPWVGSVQSPLPW